MNHSAEDRSSAAKPLFALGRVVATPGAVKALEESNQTPAEFLERHQRGDWSELNIEDRWANEGAVKHEGDLEMQKRVLSAYATSRGVKLWIVTEWDRSVTTILLPDEY